MRLLINRYRDASRDIKGTSQKRNMYIYIWNENKKAPTKSGPLEVMLLATFWLFRPQFVIFHLFWPIWRFCDLSSLISTQFLDALKHKLFNGCTWTCRRAKPVETKWRIRWKRTNWGSLKLSENADVHSRHSENTFCIDFTFCWWHLPSVFCPRTPDPSSTPSDSSNALFCASCATLELYIFSNPLSFALRLRKDFCLPGPSLKLRKWNISMICFRLLLFVPTIPKQKNKKNDVAEERVLFITFKILSERNFLTATQKVLTLINYSNYKFDLFVEVHRSASGNIIDFNGMRSNFLRRTLSLWHWTIFCADILQKMG